MQRPDPYAQVIYQVYPRSFMDSNGDGIGDLQGIIARLDHLADLGVDALWLSPIQRSPDRDFGYDIADYCDVDPRYGTLADFDALVAACRARGMGVILDGVFNHTSDRHPWFQESRASRDNPKADWYLWREQRNNWASTFGGSAWAWDAARGQHYLHSFLEEQPDLNWRNPEVVAAVEEVLRFWLARGVAGFRLDVFNCYLKHPDLPSNPRTWNPAGLLYGYIGQRHVHDRDQPDLGAALTMLRRVVDEAPGRLLVGETLDEDRRYRKAAGYCGPGPDRLHLTFNFHLLRSRWSAPAFRKAITAWAEAVGPEGLPTWVLSNHDFPRHATRWGGRWPDERARLAAMLSLTLRGVPFLYYGEEIGMQEARLTRSQLQDPVGRRFWPFHRGRDGCRTPMQWDAGDHAGFSAASPWLPLHPDHTGRTVAAQEGDPCSVLSTYRDLIALRRRLPALTRGRQLWGAPHPQVLSHGRALAPEGPAEVEVLINMSPEPQSLPPGRIARHVLYGTHRAPGEPFSLSGGTLAPHEGLVLGDEASAALALKG
ncbi:MAG: alpha-amylase family glycosyl hydrolase [Pseudomonadota bacterium]